MKHFILLASLAAGGVLRAENKAVGCPKIDLAKKYDDGIPYCPEQVKDNAFVVTRCAFDQAKQWHRATEQEKNDMSKLVSGLLKKDAKEVLARTDKLKLQVCRSAKDGDSFLLMYTKPGVKDYSGPFLMYREGDQTSGVVIHSPHDGQDGTHASTKAAFQNSNALALISNGHPRRISGRAGKTGPYPSDWAHTSSDLGYQAFQAFKIQEKSSVHLHVHGLAANKVMVTDSVGWDGPKHLLRTAFIEAMGKALTGRSGFTVEAWRFNGWITGLAMTQNEKGPGRAANERWIGMEVSVRLHQNTNVLSKAIVNLENDYLKKGRKIAVDLDKDVAAVSGDIVEEQEMESGAEESPAEEVQPLTDYAMNPMEQEVIDQKIEQQADKPPVADPNAVLEGAPDELKDDCDSECKEDDPEMQALAKAAGNAGLPPKKPLVGKRQLACVGITYKDNVNNYMTADRCLKVAKNVMEFYDKNSRGKLKLQPAGYHMDYDGGAWATFSQAEQVAKKKFDADYYVIPSLFRKGGNHASGGIAHVIQLTGWVVNHEVGHLLGLSHSGAYRYDKAGKPHYEQYGDRDSVMGGGGTGSGFLTIPHYYLKGWLNDDEVALYDPAVDYYEIKSVRNLRDKGLATLVVPPSRIGDGKGKHVFLGYPQTCDKPCVALYLSGSGSSQLVMKVQDEKWDANFTDLHLKVLPGAPKGKVRFKVDLQPKPAPKV